MSRITARGAASALACAAILFGLNAYVCAGLWSAEYLDRMSSIEGSFIAISRFAMRHWGDLAWFPAWFCGMPFLKVYQPGLHVTVAALATMFHWTPQHAYHLAIATLYSFGPVTLFWMCDRLTGSRSYAMAVALAYSLLSPVVVLSSVLRNDLGGWMLARRYQVLVDYGEGPHIAALALLPLAVWSLDRAIAQSRRWFIPLSAALLGALVVTNWTGAVGLTLALAAYFISRLGAIAWSGWLKAALLGILAYLLVSRWLPPSIVATVPGNAQASDATHFGKLHLLALGGMVLVLALAHFLFERTRADRNLRFFVYFFLVSAGIVLGKLWGNVSLLPQPHRFQLEMEMAAIGVVLFPVSIAWPRMRRSFQLGTVGILAVLGLAQLGTYHDYAESQTHPIDITGTSEYRMADWFEQHLPGHRVFAPGSISLWMNAFVDVPQVEGCCDQSVPSFEQRVASYGIYGNTTGEVSQLWLRAYGATAVGVSGPGSTEIYKPFQNPQKFEGLLPVLWRDGGNVVYQVPGRTPSLAHVILPGQEVTRPPVNGLDVGPLRAYVAALDDANFPVAEMRWVNGHQIRIRAQIRPEQRISVQTSYVPGWRASANGMPAPIHADALGLVIVEPHCDGACTVDLIYDGGREAFWTRLAQWAALIACIAWPLAARPKYS